MSKRFNVLMCKFYTLYICVVDGVINEELDNMHGVTMKIDPRCSRKVSVILIRF